MTFLAGVRSRFKATSQRNAGEKGLNVSLGILLLLTLALFVSSLVSIEFANGASSIATLWPSNAILLVALLRSRRRWKNYGFIALGGGTAIAVASLVAGNSPALSAVLTIGNIAEVLTAWMLLVIFQDDKSNPTCVRNLLVFMVLAGGVAPLASASIISTAVATNNGIPWPLVWSHWYASNSLGMIIVAPFLLSLEPETRHAVRIKNRVGEAVGVLALIMLTAAVASYYRPFLFIVAPVFLLASFRFGVMGATAGTLVLALVASVFIVKGIGPSVLSQVELSERIFALQIVLAATAFWALPVAAVLAERERLLADLSVANMRLAMEGERKSQMVAGLNRRLVDAEESERLRLSHELHDQTAQSLAAVMLELRNIETLVAEDGRERLHILRKRMAEIGKTLHRVAWELRPASIDELGLASVLSNYISEWGSQYDIDADFYSGGAAKLEELSEEARTTIYRVTQEALTNVVKHARGATSVSIVIEHVNSMIQLVIEDDGCGFNPNTAVEDAESPKGFGLAGMRERLSLLGGELEIESSVGAGTTIFARIPFESQRISA